MSVRVLEGFKFLKLNTPLHKLDPRAKFMLAAGLFSIALLFTNALAQLALLVFQAPLVALAKSVRRWLASMKAGALIAALIFALNFLFGSSLEFSLAMGIRFVNILTAFSLFFMTTSPDDLALAMEQMGFPYTFTFTFTTAIRLVPTMALDAQMVIDAQRSRGLELEKGNMFKRIRNYVPILIPLIVSAIRRSIELAEALESRAFGAYEKRQPMVTLKMRARDYLTVALTSSALAFALYAYFYIPLPELGLRLS